MSSAALPEPVPPGSRLAAVLAALLEVWPEHEKYLRRGFKTRSEPELEDSELVADCVLHIAGDELASYCESYRWTCDRLLEEEYFFRRNGRYRHATVAEVGAFEEEHPGGMEHYLRGLLLSQLLWNNHLATLSWLRRSFLPTNPTGYRHLEIGPGHGLLLQLAAADERCAAAAGWDVSETAVEETRRCLARLGTRGVEVVCHDATSGVGDGEAFDSIVMSEVLEHVERPRELLEAVARRLRSEGRIFVNMPVNSPAPDHIYLLQEPEEVVDLVASAGLAVEESAFFPMTGMTLERARQRQATISCAVVARRS